MQCVFILLTFTTNPFLPQNKPSRESIFCGKGGQLVDKKATFSVKFLAEKFTIVDGLTSGQVNELIVHLILFWHEYVHSDIRT